MKTSRILLFCIGLLALTILMVTAQQFIQVNIRSQATIRSMFGAYSDLECTQVLRNLDWGILEPDSQKTIMVYIRNTGSSNVFLSLSTRNWTPQDTEEYLSLSWDREGFDLKPNQTVEAKLTLSVSASIHGVTDFSFEILIVASEG